MLLWTSFLGGAIEAEPEWSIEGPATVNEGDTATFTVSYSGPDLDPGETATISVLTGVAAGGESDATPGVDFTALSTVMTFTGGGPASRTVAVSTIEDAGAEGSEDFAVTIGDPSTGTIATGEAITVILDDDTIALRLTSGDQQSGTDKRLTSGDQQSGTDLRIASGDQQ